MYYCYNSIILFWVKDVRKEIGEQYVLQLPCATAQCRYTCGLGVLEQSFALFVCASTEQGCWWQLIKFFNWNCSQ